MDAKQSIKYTMIKKLSKKKRLICTSILKIITSNWRFLMAIFSKVMVLKNFDIWSFKVDILSSTLQLVDLI